MPASSQSMLDFLLPLASVVYIILFVLVFLRINRERLEQEIARERNIGESQRPDAATLEEDSRERSTAFPR